MIRLTVQSVNNIAKLCILEAFNIQGYLYTKWAIFKIIVNR